MRLRHSPCANGRYRRVFSPGLALLDGMKTAVEVLRLQGRKAHQQHATGSTVGRVNRIAGEAANNRVSHYIPELVYLISKRPVGL